MGVMFISSFLLLILAFRKFGTDPSLDIGDKSIFDYLERQREQKVSDA